MRTRTSGWLHNGLQRAEAEDNEEEAEGDERARFSESGSYRIEHCWYSHVKIMNMSIHTEYTCIFDI